MREHPTEHAAATFEVFFDGDCPMCRREISMLRRFDRRERIRFTDIAARDFDASTVGKSHGELMARIYGRDLETGVLVDGVEVFRRLYAAVGFGPVVAITRVPPFSWALDKMYAWFARNRLRLTGRACTNESCGVPAKG